VTISRAAPTLSISPDELEDLDRRHLIHPLLSGDRTDRCVIVRGKGSTVWDARGNELLDMTGGGNWLAQVGHGRVELGEVMAEQVARLPYFTSFFEFSNDQSIQLAKRLTQLAPDGFNRVFYTSGGSEGVDIAIKAARLYHTRRGEADRTWIISRQMGYHGSTYGGGSATGFDFVHYGVGPTLPHVRKVSPPFPFHPEMYGGEQITDFLVRELEQAIEEIGPGNVAAMIGEPVMRRRRRGPAGGLLATGTRGAEPARHPADRRRGGHRVRPDRQLVRLAPTRHGARRDRHREGHHQRVRAAGRGTVARRDRRRDRRR